MRYLIGWCNVPWKLTAVTWLWVRVDKARVVRNDKAASGVGPRQRNETVARIDGHKPVTIGDFQSRS